MLYQLSYEATHWERGQFIEFIYWWAELREIIDPDRGCEYILWSKKVILIEGKTVFYRHYFDNGVIFTKDLLYDMAKLEQWKSKA